jgi:hypothetical protein
MSMMPSSTPAALPASSPALLAAQSKAGQAGVDAYQAALTELQNQRQQAVSQAMQEAAMRGAPGQAVASIQSQITSPYDASLRNLTQSQANFQADQAARASRLADYSTAIGGTRNLIGAEAAQAVAPIQAKSAASVANIEAQSRAKVADLAGQAQLALLQLQAKQAAAAAKAAKAAQPKAVAGGDLLSILQQGAVQQAQPGQGMTIADVKAAAVPGGSLTQQQAQLATMAANYAGRSAQQAQAGTSGTPTQASTAIPGAVLPGPGGPGTGGTAQAFQDLLTKNLQKAGIDTSKGLTISGPGFAPAPPPGQAPSYTAPPQWFPAAGAPAAAAQTTAAANQFARAQAAQAAQGPPPNPAIDPAAEARRAFQGMLATPAAPVPLPGGGLATPPPLTQFRTFIPPVTTEAAQGAVTNPATYQAMIDTLRAAGVNIPETTSAATISKLMTQGQQAITTGTKAAETAATKAAAAGTKSDLQDMRNSFAQAFGGKDLAKVASAAKMTEPEFASTAAADDFRAFAQAYQTAKPTFANTKAATAWLNGNIQGPNAGQYRTMVKALYG